MRNYYVFLLLILVAGLESCSSDTADHSAERTKRSTTAAQIPSAPAAPRALSPVEKQKASLTQSGIRQPADVMPPKRALPTTTPQMPYRQAWQVLGLKRRWVARPSSALASAPSTTLANISSDTIADALQGIDALPETVEDRQAELTKFLASGLPNVQLFTVQHSRDTVLIGQQGTQIFVPAYAWNVPQGTAPIRVQLREFYSVPDVVVAGLSTSASGVLLETGGMLKITASITTDGGLPVTLRPGMRLGLRMPTAQIKPDMQSFWGDVSGEHPDWHLDTLATTQLVGLTSDFGIKQRKRRKNKRSSQKSLRDEWPVYLTSERRQVRELVRGVAYPAPVITKLRHVQKKSAQERAVVSAYNAYVTHKKSGKLEKIHRAAEVEFTVDTTGATTNVKMRPGYNAALAAPVLAIVQSWQSWKPAQLSRSYLVSSAVQFLQTKRKEPVVGVVRVVITVSGKILVAAPTWDAQATYAMVQTRAAAERLALYRTKVAAATTRRDSILRTNGTLPLAGEAAPTVANLFYELNSAGMGWINCDRFLNAPQPLFTFELPTPAPDDKMMLVFRGTRTILNGVVTTTGEKVSFGQVPSGTEATIVAMRWQGGQAFLATQSAMLSAKRQPEKLDYRPVTMLDLQAALAKLD